MSPDSPAERPLLARFIDYVNTDASDEPYLEDVLAEAVELVDHHIGPIDTVPDKIRDRAILEVGSELYHRRQAPNGISQFATPDGPPIRVARDPMVGAYPILRPYVGLGIS